MPDGKFNWFMEEEEQGETEEHVCQFRHTMSSGRDIEISACAQCGKIRILLYEGQDIPEHMIEIEGRLAW